MKHSTHWKASKRPGKQRLYAATRPMHKASKALATHLAKPLREKHKHRSIRIIVGDTVVVTTGQWKKKTGTVSAVNVKKQLVYVNGVEMQKKDGSKSRVPLRASNLMITQLNETKGRL